MVDRRDLVDRSAIIRPELIEVRFIMKEHDDLRIVQLDVEFSGGCSWPGRANDAGKQSPRPRAGS